MKPRIIVCGLGCTGYRIFCLLKQQGAEVRGMNDRPLQSQQMAHASDIVIGPLRSADTLRAAGITDAHTLVIASDDDALNLGILTQARILNPQVRIVNRLFNASLGSRLDRTLPDHVSMSVAALAAPVLTFAAMGNQAIGQLRLGNQTWPIHEERIDDHHPWYGRSLHDLWDERRRMLIYYLPAQDPTDLVSAMLAGRCLDRGDRIIVATQPSIRTSRQTFSQQIHSLLTNLNHIQRQVRPTLAVLLLLLLTIFTATLTYTAVSLNTSIVDALYFSVGMITGAGGNEAIAEQADEHIKVFTVIMMLVGTGVIGVCYALLNDMILGTHLRQFWNTARVPQRNHYIICGLGGIGVQVMQQLQANGCEVVVVDQDPSNRFLNAARSLRIPVIQGDASLADSLEAARIRQADALLAVTSDDVANLEIALSAKGLAPRLPVVMRTQDPEFAAQAQQIFDFEAILSPVDLAALSFAAAALGGRILGNGMTADTLWIALATIITPGHPFCGQRVKDVAMAADCVPLYVETLHQTVHGWDLLEVNLAAGDVLYLTIPAKNLEQLWRSHPTPLAVPLYP
ncbi:MAG: NAD-binding protein [Synechococcales bacterium]|nr:NAD-binding protein [Synechococcales bacterium]